MIDMGNEQPSTSAPAPATSSRIAGDESVNPPGVCPNETVSIRGLRAEVEILRDEWGVPHIYATCTEDLFFAQGFAAARDRLFQLEMWRRARTGELSTVLGSAFIESDRHARLMKFRGDAASEWAAYGRETQSICASFAKGVNAFIEYCGDNLPVEFQILNFRPVPWEPEHCLLREFSPRITFNAQQELARTDLINAVGLAAAMKYLPTDPPHLPTIYQDADLSGLSPAILGAFDGGASVALPHDGSNCWAVAGALTSSGKPLLASDPHRPLTLPSLRYVCHLVAPHWNVIGAGEPALPGIALGHNEHIAFGFTVAQFDQTDLYIETTSQTDAQKYLADDEWVKMTIVREELRVKGKDGPVFVELKYTRHGPVIWEDHETNRALAIRWAGAEPGSAPYLGCLAVDQAHDWPSFRTALRGWRMPSENMIFADVHNNIGWTAVGLLPVRRWDGLLPVAGHNGEWEWQGFVPQEQLPYDYNPVRQFVASANDNIVPPNYPFHIGYDWKAPYRIERIRSVLGQKRDITQADCAQLQADELSLQARKLIDLLRPWITPAPVMVHDALEMLLNWNCVLAAESPAAALFEIWLSQIRSHFLDRHVDATARSVVTVYLQLDTIIRQLPTLATDLLRGLLIDSLMAAVNEGISRLGPDMAQWKWGAMHVLRFRHPLVGMSSLDGSLNISDLECGGDDETVNSTRGPNYTCNYGASYRQLLDLSNWDRSSFINLPGQSGDPRSPHYSDHVTFWRRKDYAPLLYSRDAVQQHAAHRTILQPLGIE